MSEAFEHICKNTYTTSDLHRRLGLLQECLEEVLYDNAVGTDALLSAGVAYAEKVGSASDAAALLEWGNEVWNIFQTQNLVDQVAALKKEAELLPTLKVYFPVAFDDAGIKIISVWCREHIKPQLLLEVLVDPSVVGGCSFVFNDTHHDYSLRHAMQKHKGIVSELLTSYV